MDSKLPFTKDVGTDIGRVTIIIDESYGDEWAIGKDLLTLVATTRDRQVGKGNVYIEQRIARKLFNEMMKDKDLETSVSNTALEILVDFIERNESLGTL